MDNIILRCDNNINGIFSAIYDAFVYKNQIQKENHEVYRDNISIEIGIGGQNDTMILCFEKNSL